MNCKRQLFKSSQFEDDYFIYKNKLVNKYGPKVIVLYYTKTLHQNNYIDVYHIYDNNNFKSLLNYVDCNDIDLKKSYILKITPDKIINIIISLIQYEFTIANFNSQNVILQTNELKKINSFLHDCHSKQGFNTLNIKESKFNTNYNNYAFLSAVKNNLTPWVDYWIDKKINLDIKDHRNYTPLLYAIKNNNQRVVDLLIKYKANINYKSRGKKTPILFATYCGNINIVKTLIKANVNINITNSFNMNALNYAIYKKNTQIVSLLLKHNINVNNRDRFLGDTPLLYAIRFSNYPIVKELLTSKKLDINMTNLYSYNAILYACRYNEYDIANELLKTGLCNLEQKTTNTNQSWSNGFTALSWATHNNKPNIITKLLEYKANINTQNVRGYTPLILSCITDSSEVTKTLLQYNVNTNKYDYKKMTPLMYCVLFKSTYSSKQLLEKYVNINSKNYLQEDVIDLAKKLDTPLYPILVDYKAKRIRLWKSILTKILGNYISSDILNTVMITYFYT